jgi:hypothetical protein
MSEVATQSPSETKEPTANKTPESPSSVVDALFDLGTTWAAYGLKMGKTALEQSAKTLETTAKTLEGFAHELEKK